MAPFHFRINRTKTGRVSRDGITRTVLVETEDATTVEVAEVQIESGNLRRRTIFSKKAVVDQGHDAMDLFEGKEKW